MAIAIIAIENSFDTLTDEEDKISSKLSKDNDDTMK